MLVTSSRTIHPGEALCPARSHRVSKYKGLTPVKGRSGLGQRPYASTREDVDVPRREPYSPSSASIQRDPQSRPLIPVVDLEALSGVLLGTRSETEEDAPFLTTILTNDGGPPRMFSPLVPSASSRPREALPLMFYLPGIDGTGLAAHRQFPSLCASFDLRAMSIPPQDRSSFEAVVDQAVEAITWEVQGTPPDRPVYLLGESFGGLTCLAVALKIPQYVDRIVLVNPATSFGRSLWPQAGPLLSQMPDEVYRLLPFLMGPMLMNPLAMAAPSTPVTNPLEALSEVAYGLLDLLPELGALRQVLPAQTLAWRLKLLSEGSDYLEGKLAEVSQRVFILAGENDQLIPSREEADRLRRALPRAFSRVLPGRSHSLLQEKGVDLAQLMKEEGFYVEQRVMSNQVHRSRIASGATPLSPPIHRAPGVDEVASHPRSSRSIAVPQGYKNGHKKVQVRVGGRFGAAVPIEMPTMKEIDRATEGGVKLLRQVVSPVFYSTDSTGRVHQGLGGVPDRHRPLLFVGNHQLFAADMVIFGEQLLREKNILVRGMAHPIIFGEGRDRRDMASFSSFLTTFGAVPVSPKNMYDLLAQGEAVLLYPGGAREAFKRKNENYQLFWPNKSEFVRMAARFGATIIPFAAIGADEGVNQVLDANDLMNLPFVSDYIKRSQQAIPAARRGVNVVEEVEDITAFVSPLITFNTPRRFYYLFQRPIATSPEMARNREECDRVYGQVKSEVEQGLQYLLGQRALDPYRDLLPRLLYEGARGGTQQAPSFIP